MAARWPADGGEGVETNPVVRLGGSTMPTTAKLTLIMCALICLGCVNFVLLKELYTAYGAENAFFVNQGVNLLYIVYGGVILYPRMCLTSVVTPEMRALPKKRFVVMGCLDALGTFFTAMGAAFTPGSMQPLLNQTLIFWIIVISRTYLKKVFSGQELFGAATILFGACLSAMPQVLLPHSEDQMRWYAVCLYAFSSVPMAMSACYKEGSFKEHEIDVWYLTQWVSVVQFWVSFLLLPLLCIPGFGSVQGTNWQDLPAQFWGGWQCCLQATPECADKNTFWLLIGYCAVNVCFNTLGLYVVKVASALLNALSYAILLPCTTLLFFTSFAGMAQEQFTNYNWFTVAGLVMVLVGFGQYQKLVPVPTLAGKESTLLQKAVADPKCDRRHRMQQSFQERIVGAGLEHGFGVDVAEARRLYGTDGQLAEPLVGPAASNHGGEALRV